MPSRAKSICRRVGCNALIDRPGYCPAHTIDPREKARENFRALDERKTDEQKAFYSSAAWTQASRRHRANDPLCSRCRERGIIQAGQLVHHNPPLDELIARGLNPLDDRYLETLCNRCHLEELRGKKCQK